MPRIARIIAPGIPHHLTERGDRRMDTFFWYEDYQADLALMGDWCRKCNVAVLGLLPEGLASDSNLLVLFGF